MKDFSVVAKKVTRVPIRFNSNFLEKNVENEKIKKNLPRVDLFFTRVFCAESTITTTIDIVILMR